MVKGSRPLPRESHIMSDRTLYCGVVLIVAAECSC